MPAPSAPLHSPLPRWLIALALVVATAAFAPTLGGGFLGDDFVYVSRFSEFPWSGWPRLFIREWSEGIWGFQLSELRPFAALSFMADARLWDGNALGYRLTNLGLHLSATLLVLYLAWYYGRGSVTAACVAAIGFALHPAHAEAVAWITGRVDLIATVCALGFWLVAEQWSERGKAGRLALAGGVLFVGLFSKELCLFAPPLLLLRWLLVDPRAGRSIWRRRAALLGAVIVVVGIYALCRHAALTNPTTGGGGWGNDDAWRRQAHYLGWLAPLLPLHGQKEWVAPLSPSLLRAFWIAFALLVAGALAIALQRRSTRAGDALFFTGVWYLVTVGGFLVVGYFTPRHLYFPTTGLAIGTGLVVATVCRTRWMRTAIGGALIGWCAVAHVVAIQPWRQAGVLSREIIATLNARFVAAPAGTLVFTSVPEILGSAYVWAWSSPHALGPPFLTHPVAAEDVYERLGNYYRPDHWQAARQPVARMETAPGAFALVADTTGRVRQRDVPREQLQARANTLATLARDGITSDEWTDWVTTLLEP